MIRTLVAAIVIALAAGEARADDAADFAAASARGDLDALEALGAKSPVTMWSDDAWSEAARLAERAGDVGRARRDFERVVAIGGDGRLVERARAALVRLGATDRWDATSKTHDALVARIVEGGDPTAPLEELETLVRTESGYPRGVVARLFLARTWELEGETDRAIAWLVDAKTIASTPLDRERAATDYARVLVRHDRDGARDAVTKVADPTMRVVLAADLASAVRRTWLHRAAWLALALALAGAAVALRRTWRVMARPPTEVIFVAPIALIMTIVAQTGNPLVGRAVLIVAPAGLAIAWLASAVLDARRSRRALVLVSCAAVVTAVCVAYLAIDRGSLSSMVAETWRAGPQR